MRLALVISLAALVFSGCVFHSHTPQTATFTGRIVDCRSGEPISGASVMLKGTKLGAMSDYDGVFTVTRIPLGTYDCINSAVSYEPKVIERIGMRKGVVSYGDVALSRFDPAGFATLIDTADTVPPSAADLYNRRLRTHEDSVVKQADEQRLFKEVAAIHLRNLNFLLSGQSDSLAYNLDSIYVDLVYGCRVWPDTARLTRFGELFQTRSYARLRGAAAPSLVNCSEPVCILITKHTRWSRLRFDTVYALGLLREGDVLIIFSSRDSDLLPYGWIGAYRKVNQSWVMVLASLPCRC